jgi:hypothetical protein
MITKYLPGKYLIKLAKELLRSDEGLFTILLQTSVFCNQNVIPLFADWSYLCIR